MVSGKQKAGLTPGETKVVGGMAGGVDRLQGPPVAGYDVTVGQPMVGREIHVAALLDLDTDRPFTAAMGTEGGGRRAGRRL